ncbi:MAG: hypothetical protein ICV60_05740 [Pyrinomonadaceae bacterium]|nr:hypothetical protein [Pyrinomonadaceae bacterium]
MRRHFPNWSKQNLYTRGHGPNQKIGWIEKYGWEQTLKEKIAQANSAMARTSEEALFIEIEQSRKRLHEKIQTGNADRDAVYQHLAYCRMSITALANLKGAGNTFESFVAFWEFLLEVLVGLSDSAARALLDVADEVLAKAREKYGEQETAADQSNL